MGKARSDSNNLSKYPSPPACCTRQPGKPQKYPVSVPNASQRKEQQLTEKLQILSLKAASRIK